MRRRTAERYAFRTDNVPGIAGLGVAAKKIYENLEEDTARMRALKGVFCGRAENNRPGGNQWRS